MPVTQMGSLVVWVIPGQQGGGECVKIIRCSNAV